MSELAYKRTNVYETADERKLKEIFDYAEGYRAFIDAAKTEREACDYVAEEAEKRGYKPFKFGAKLKAGDRVYYNNRGKNIYLIKVGTEDIARDGIRIVASHIDSPRVDLKQVPLYESDGVALAKTHYYGGIRKYQWAAIPLALHGRIVRADGTAFDVKIGEDDNDPVFYISDLLPHLAAKQNAKPLGEGLGGEDLNIWLGNMPYTAAEEDKDKTVKENLLRILHEKYGVREEDFLSAELSLVPAFRAKDVGFDRGLMAAYGHDDRVCSYPAYTALFDEEPEMHTVMVVLADKEEIGSEGATGMQCAIFTDLIDALAASFGVTSAEVRAASKCLSADVNAGYDGVVWQTGELGKVDVGGGGTVAKFIAKMNIDTVDIGVPVISMHSPYEVISKADLYEAYRAFRAFIK